MKSLFFFISLAVINNHATKGEAHLRHLKDDVTFGGALEGRLITHLEVSGAQSILGGQPIPAYSWTVVIGKNQCAGTLVHRDVVMTTASCLSAGFGGTPSHVTVAPSNLTRLMDVPVNMSGTVIHACYSPPVPPSDYSATGNIALIQLLRPLPDDYTPVKLNQYEKRPFANGETLAILGYGTNVSGRVSASPNLIEGFTEYLNTCYTRYPAYDKEAQLCALGGDKKVGICNGDMGGPIFDISIANGKAEFISQVGIAAAIYVKYKNETCANGNVDVFTRVSTYYDWVYSQICAISSDTTGVNCAAFKMKNTCAKSGGGKKCGCFSESSSVNVLGSGHVPMKEVKIGDHVLSAKGKYEPIYAFGHMEKNTQAPFLQIMAADSYLEVTQEHLIYLQGKSNPVRADSIKIGDILQSQGSTAEVTNIRKLMRTGLYAPLTESGTVVVDGISVSAYIAVQEDAVEFAEYQDGSSSRILSQHDIAHMALSPLRMLCLGINSNVCSSERQEGMLPYVSRGLSVAKWADQQSTFIQCVVFLLFMSVFGIVYVTEFIVGAQYTPVILLFMILCFCYNHGPGIKKLKIV